MTFRQTDIIKKYIINNCKQIKKMLCLFYSSETLRPLMSSLKALQWANSLRSLRLPVDLFQGFHMQYLSLSNDGLDDLSFLSQTIVVHLDLSFNHLFYFDVGIYPGLTYTEVLNLRSTDLKQFYSSRDVVLNELYELDISANQLTHLDLAVFHKVPHLRHLNAAYNLLTTFPKTLDVIFHGLHYLDITGNKLICDCSLHWFISLSHKIQFSTDLVIEGVHCDVGDARTQSLGIYQHIRTAPCEPPLIMDLTSAREQDFEQRLFNSSFKNTNYNNECLEQRRKQNNTTSRCDYVYNTNNDSTVSPSNLRIRCSAVGQSYPGSHVVGL